MHLNQDEIQRYFSQIQMKRPQIHTLVFMSPKFPARITVEMSMEPDITKDTALELARKFINTENPKYTWELHSHSRKPIPRY